MRLIMTLAICGAIGTSSALGATGSEKHLFMMDFCHDLQKFYGGGQPDMAECMAGIYTAPPETMMPLDATMPPNGDAVLKMIFNGNGKYGAE